MDKTKKNIKNFVISSLTMNKHHYKFEKNFIDNLLKNYKNYKIYLLVSQKGIIKKNKRISEVYFPLYSKSIIYRLYLFYFGLKSISKKINPDIWFSCDSLTPNVITKRLFSYYHTPSPFFKLKLPNFKNNIIFYLQGLIYNFFIKILIKKNTKIVVQSKWMKKEFIKRYKMKNIIVAHLDYVKSSKNKTIHKKFKNFYYPSYPYIYKNFEILGECAKILDNNQDWNGKILLTIDTKKNNYAKSIFKKYKNYNSLKFIGYQSHKNILKLYKSSDALIFPSLMETWGLPISEAKKYNLPILASKVDYSRESVGKYHSTIFFDPYSANELSKILISINKGEKIFKKSLFVNPKNQYAQNNNQLIKMLIND